MSTIVFAQWSDMHIGQRLMDNKFGNWPPFSGYNPHESKLLPELEDALDDARIVTGLTDAETLPIVFSGDLTAGGTNNDYAIAFAIFFQHWQWRYGEFPRWIGFGYPHADVLMVPGNHDHWNSDFFQRAFTSSLSPSFFQKTPWRHDLTSSDGALRLELHGIDSNAGLLGVPYNWNLFAEGKLLDIDVVQLAEQLRVSSSSPRLANQACVRAFVCHHALSPSRMAKGLDTESRGLLQYLAARYRVRAVLTGHNHEFPLSVPYWSDNYALTTLRPALERLNWTNHDGFDPTWGIYELRCTTTLAGPAAPACQGFYLHRLALVDSSRRIEWRTWKYQLGAKTFSLESLDGEVIFETPPEGD